MQERSQQTVPTTVADETEIELSFDPARNIAYLRLAGVLDRDTILNTLDRAVADPRYRSGMARLWDFTGADLSLLETSTITAMARHSARFPIGISDVKVALVADSDLEYGLSKMFEAFSQQVNPSVLAFKSMDEAEEWLAG